MKQPNSKILAGLMGVCVGDALGVPVEFTSRSERSKSPVKTMQGYGTYNQPPGTWSDDSSLTFCLAECLCNGFNLDAIAKSFCRWYTEGYWTAHGTVFDIGMATSAAIQRLRYENISPLEAGGKSESSNGNGSLMRILPLAFYYQSLQLPELLERVHHVSCITHAHPRCQVACGIYISIAICLLQGFNLAEAYFQGIQTVREIYTKTPLASELPNFARVFSGDIAQLPVNKIESGGYVIHTLEASLWCLLNSNSYKEAVLTAVNLGEDSDTTAAVTGGLAGLYYGVENIPAEWINQIARKDDIIALAERLEAAIYS